MKNKLKFLLIILFILVFIVITSSCSFFVGEKVVHTGTIRYLDIQRGDFTVGIITFEDGAVYPVMLRKYWDKLVSGRTYTIEFSSPHGMFGSAANSGFTIKKVTEQP